ncbi:MAG: hypothetical protein ACOH1Y_04455 [Propionicimonas sp.]
MNVTRTFQLNLLGQSPRERQSLAKDGRLVLVRHGAYADEPAADALARHRQLIAGTVPLLGPGTVLSHVSAGVLHGLPSWASMLSKVTVLRRSPGHGSSRRYLHVRVAPLAFEEVAEVDGCPVTTLERTALDLSLCLTFERAVAVLDAAVHQGADPQVLGHSLAAAAGRHGVGAARAALASADGRSESVAESVSRVRMAEAGLPSPELQLNVFDDHGAWVARCDFGWEERGVLGEFDGRIKYTGTPDEVARAVMREKKREARLRELGWVVVRWDWDHLADPSGLRRRIQAAFAQARPATIRGHVEASASSPQPFPLPKRALAPDLPGASARFGS